MPETSDGKKQAIRDLRVQGWSKNKTGEAIDVSDMTVDKYEPDDVEGYDKSLEPSPTLAVEHLSPELNPAEVLCEEWLPENYDSESGEEFTDIPPGESPLRDESEKQSRVKQDYTDTTPDSFIRGFFEELEVGVRDSWVDLQARRAGRRSQIPDRERIRSDLLNMGSGVSNEREVGYIADEYWAEAQRYISESNYDVSSSGVEDSGNTPRGESDDQGGFVAPGQQQTREGSWMQVPGKGQVYGRMVEGQNGEMIFQPMQPPQQGQQMPGGQHPGGQQPPGQQMRGPQGPQNVQELQREIRNLRDEVGSKSGDSGLKEQVEQMVELREAMERLEGDSADEQTKQAFAAVRQEIGEIKREMTEDGGGGGETTDPRERFLERAMSSDDIDMDTAMRIADKFEGSKSAEVRKKEIDRELELNRMEKKKERTETVVNGLQQLTQNFGAALGAALVDSGDDGGQDEQQNGGNNHQQQPPRQTTQESQRAQTPPRGDGGVQSRQQGSKTRQMQCPSCGEMTSSDPDTPRFECEHCDYSVVPCSECSSPLELPPEDELERGGCPDCNTPLMEPPEGTNQVACTSCGEVWDYESHKGETVTCDDCGAEHEVSASPEAGV